MKAFCTACWSPPDAATAMPPRAPVTAALLTNWPIVPVGILDVDAPA